VKRSFSFFFPTKIEELMRSPLPLSFFSSPPLLVPSLSFLLTGWAALILSHTKPFFFPPLPPLFRTLVFIRRMNLSSLSNFVGDFTCFPFFFFSPPLFFTVTLPSGVEANLTFLFSFFSPPFLDFLPPV